MTQHYDSSTASASSQGTEQPSFCSSSTSSWEASEATFGNPPTFWLLRSLASRRPNSFPGKTLASSINTSVTLNNSSQPRRLPRKEQSYTLENSSTVFSSIWSATKRSSQLLAETWLTLLLEDGNTYPRQNAEPQRAETENQPRPSPHIKATRRSIRKTMMRNQINHLNDRGAEVVTVAGAAADRPRATPGQTAEHLAPAV